MRFHGNRRISANGAVIIKPQQVTVIIDFKTKVKYSKLLNQNPLKINSFNSSFQLDFLVPKINYQQVNMHAALK